MPYLNVSDLAKAATFRAKLSIALVNACGPILLEAANGRTDVHMNKRYELARNVLRDPDAMVPAFVYPVLTNQQIAAAGLDATDDALRNQAAAVWDVVAGVTAADKIPPS